MTWRGLSAVATSVIGSNSSAANGLVAPPVWYSSQPSTTVSIATCSMSSPALTGQGCARRQRTASANRPSKAMPVYRCGVSSATPSPSLTKITVAVWPITAEKRSQARVRATAGMPNSGRRAVAISVARNQIADAAEHRTFFLAAAGAGQHAAGHARERQRLQPDLARAGQRGEEHAFAAEHHALDAADRLHVEADAVGQRDHAAGVHVEAFARRELALDDG